MAHSLSAALAKVLPAKAKEDSRFNISALHVEVVRETVTEGGSDTYARLVLTATDGYRLAVYKNPTRGFIISSHHEACKLLLGHELVGVLDRCCTRSEHGALLTITPKELIYVGRNYALTLKGQNWEDNSYPNTKSVMDFEGARPIAYVKRQLLLDYLRVIPPKLLRRPGQVQFKLGRDNTASEWWVELTEIEVEFQLDKLFLAQTTSPRMIAVTPEMEFRPELLALDATYLYQALKTFDSEVVTIEANHNKAFDGPVLLTGSEDPGLQHLIMPMPILMPV